MKYTCTTRETLVNLVDSAWNDLWSAGITNPIDISRIFSEIATSRSRTSGTTLIDQLKVDQGLSRAIERASTTFTHLLNDSSSGDHLGDIYEYILSHLSTAGHFGQFRTPTHLISFIYDVFPPLAQGTILDPACGTGGFLIEANKRRADNHFIGCEIDRSVFELAVANGKLHGIERLNVMRQSGIGLADLKPDLIATNPPFSGTFDEPYFSDIAGLITSKTELAFLCKCLELLEESGRCAIVLPLGVASNTSKEFVKARKALLKNASIKAIVELPRGSFLPYTDAKTVIIFFEKNRRGTSEFISAVCTDDGFTLDDARKPTETSTLPIIARCIGLGIFSPGSSFCRESSIQELDDYLRLVPSRINSLASSTISFQGKQRSLKDECCAEIDELLVAVNKLQSDMLRLSTFAQSSIQCPTKMKEDAVDVAL